MRITLYAIRLGGKLYVDSKSYGWYPSTTSHIEHALWLTDLQQALKISKKSGGEVIEFYLSDDDTSEVDMLRASIKQLQKERDEAIEELNAYKANGVINV